MRKAVIILIRRKAITGMLATLAVVKRKPEFISSLVYQPGDLV